MDVIEQQVEPLGRQAGGRLGGPRAVVEQGQAVLEGIVGEAAEIKLAEAEARLQVHADHAGKGAVADVFVEARAIETEQADRAVARVDRRMVDQFVQQGLVAMPEPAVAQRKAGRRRFARARALARPIDITTAEPAPFAVTLVPLVHVASPVDRHVLTGHWMRGFRAGAGVTHARPREGAWPCLT